MPIMIFSPVPNLMHHPLIDQRLAEGHGSAASIKAPNQILDQIRLSGLLSNPPNIPENQLMTSPLVKIESLKTLDVSSLQKTKPSGSEDNAFDCSTVNEIPSADQILVQRKSGKEASQEL